MTYTCFMCDKTVTPQLLRKKIRCPYCGSKMLFKPRVLTTTVRAI